jgi:hypothetical protein
MTISRALFRSLLLLSLPLAGLSTIAPLGTAALDACVANMQRMDSRSRYNGLGEAWNVLSVRERHDVLQAVADIEKQDVTPEELRALARLEDDVAASGLGANSCLPGALVTSTRAVWGALTREERELVYHELHMAL